MKPKPSLLLHKHTPPCSVNTQGVGQMVPNSMGVPVGVNNTKLRWSEVILGWSMTVVLAKNRHSLNAIVGVAPPKQWFSVLHRKMFSLGG